MKHVIALVLVIGTLHMTNAQSRVSRQPQTQPTADQIEKRKKEAEEKRDELVSNFVNSLEGDDFQKQIVKQYMDSYVDEKMTLINFEISQVADP